MGSLGFLTPFQLDSFKSVIDQVLQGMVIYAVICAICDGDMYCVMVMCAVWW